MRGFAPTTRFRAADRAAQDDGAILNGYLRLKGFQARIDLICIAYGLSDLGVGPDGEVGDVPLVVLQRPVHDDPIVIDHVDARDPSVGACPAFRARPSSEVKRIALAADSRLASEVPRLAAHFVEAELKSFGYEELDRAIAWAGQATAPVMKAGVVAN